MSDGVAQKGHSTQNYKRSDDSASGGSQCRNKQCALHKPELHWFDNDIQQISSLVLARRGIGELAARF
jgi:hypothetical protein